MVKKLLSVLLATLLIVIALVSCSNPSDPKNNGSNSATDSQQDKPEDLLSYLPDKKFKGEKYTIFDCDEDGNVPQVVDLSETEEASEVVVVDAIYKRNLEIEERYNVKIVEFNVSTNWDDRWSKLRDAIIVGEDIYDLAVCATIRGGLSLVYDNIVSDFSTFPYIDLENPWWNQVGNMDLTFFGKQYFANSPIDMNLYMRPFVLYTNLDIVDELQMESPTKAVADYSWTADLMQTYCKAANKDVNGDTFMTGEDRYGFSGVDYNTFPEILAGFGVTTVVMDEDDYPVLNTSASMISAYERAYDLFYGGEASYYNNNTTWDANARDQMEHFSAELALFTMYDMSINVWSKMRKIEFNLTVLPVPMLNENQKAYYTYVQNPFMLAIPSTAATHAERTGLITEALSAVAYTKVLPAYYETALKEKYTRDEDGTMKKMIDLIYSNIVMDRGIVFWDDAREIFLQALYSRNRMIVSVLATKERTINRSMGKDIDKIFDNIGV